MTRVVPQPPKTAASVSHPIKPLEFCIRLLQFNWNDKVVFGIYWAAGQNVEDFDGERVLRLRFEYLGEIITDAHI